MRFVIPILCLLVFLLPLFCTEVQAAPPNVILKAGHIPTYENIKFLWYGNTGRVSVTLKFKGPWNFTAGPKQLRFTETLMEAKDAFNYSKFPGATYAIERVIGPQKMYQFYKKTKQGLIFFGLSSTPAHPETNFALVPPSRNLFFPSKVGRVVTQNFIHTDLDGDDPCTTISKIVAKGTVIVGAGTFNDTVMVQHKTEARGNDPYSNIIYEWYAPFVGKVALIRSRDGETKDLFTVAEGFEWMNSCTMP